jgi:predicted GH43/DUF377 family glycosyl hydrolase
MRTEPVRVTRFGPRLHADPARVVTRLFVPGEELPEGASRGHTVVDRVMDLSDDQVDQMMDQVRHDFTARHHDLDGVLREHFQLAVHGRPGLEQIPAQRQLLIGAYFTMEYAVESAALFNPSMVAHPDQRDLAPGQVRFLMSVRSVGEGHRSTVEFRTGVLGPGPTLTLDDPGRLLVAGTARGTLFRLDVLRRQLADLGADAEMVDQVLLGLPDRFDAGQLRQTLAACHPHLRVRPAAHRVVEQIDQVLAGEYEVEFPAATAVAERLLWPVSPEEFQGIEDVRLVEFDDGPDANGTGTARYLGTYTAYDGQHIAPKVLATNDFRTFTVGGLTGPAARNKGMALFPRRVGGRFLALSRWDRENVSLAASADGRCWEPAGTVHAPSEGWELVQVGNCGSPVETEAGWLVLTHGVGPLRTYGIGVLLLDLDEPTRCLASLPGPLLRAEAGEREGYVPNVVYSCGALRHGDLLTIPYGISDSAIGFAQVDIRELLARMRPAR